MLSDPMYDRVASTKIVTEKKNIAWPSVITLFMFAFFSGRYPMPDDPWEYPKGYALLDGYGRRILHCSANDCTDTHAHFEYHFRRRSILGHSLNDIADLAFNND